MRKWLGYLAVAGLVFLLDGWGWWSWLKSPMAKIFQPLRSKAYQMTIEEPMAEAVMETGESLIMEGELEKVRRENVRLRQLLETPLDPSWKFVEGMVLSFSQNRMRIDVGEKMGIKAGQVVMGLVKEGVNNGVVIGKVDEVFEYEAEVRLLADEGMRVGVQNLNGVRGVVVGDEKGGLKLIEVLQKEAINQDELLVSLGGDGWLPDLVVGQVAEVVKDDAAVFKTAQVKEVVDVSRLVSVFVVAN